MDSILMDDPWAVDPAGFADCHGSGARLRFLLNYAVLAPSGHNTQPWLFRLRGDDLLELRADRSRALPVVDPADRALTISCGAALANLRHAAAALGEALEVTVLPDPGDRDLLAAIRGLGPCPAAPASARLLRAITARRTTRFAFAPDPVPEPLRVEAIAAAEEAGAARLHWFDAPARRHALAALVAEGDRIQMADPAFRHELSAWMRSRRGAGRDGLSGAAFGMPDLFTFAAALVVRTFDMGAGQAARDQELAEGSPALAVLATPGDTPRDWIATGEALQRTLLAVTAGGFTASFLNQSIEVASLRPRLAAELGEPGVPQILLRIGRGPRPIAAVRRPVREVLREAEA
ncbi:Acg family FMN-binding oxidoreductase [Falsiroseomonas sp.]|uniref:Acg family FMN-binding oxidoreductase n=1 Tax=Falsiroseomonas sp. TaxID=2870721 RepID=UPI003568A63F